jgi:hypothetical protein
MKLKAFRRPPIAGFVVSCILSCGLFFFFLVLFDLFGLGGSFLVLMREQEG